MSGAGHEIVSIDQQPAGIEGVTEQRLNLLSPDTSGPEGLDALLREQDVVVHLASLTSPFQASPEVVFRSVVEGSFTVLAAAGRVGMRRAVLAGSINELGMFFGHSGPDLPYLPVDEAIPAYTTDPYSFGKAMLEEVASYARRLYGISSAVLRFPMTADYDGESGANVLRALRTARPELLRLLDADPAAARREYQERLARYRRGRAAQLRTLGEPRLRGEQVSDSVVHLALNFFSTLHTREAARAVEACLSADFDGSHACYISDPNNDMGLPPEDLAALFYPGVPYRHDQRPVGKAPVARADVAGFIDTRRLQALTGWKPAWTIAERYPDIRK